MRLVQRRQNREDARTKLLIDFTRHDNTIEVFEPKTDE